MTDYAAEMASLSWDALIEVMFPNGVPAWIDTEKGPE